MIGAGISLALAASIANAFAVVLQASEARRTSACQAVRFSLLVSLAHRPRWLAGTGLLILVWPLQVLALTFAPITVVQPILAMSQLILLAVARRNGEQVGRTEAFAVFAIVGGVIAVVLASPRHAVLHPHPGRVAIPLLVVGVAAIVAFAVGRLHPSAGFSLVVGAGLGYAWADFANKLLSNEISSGRALLAIVWLLATVGFGSLAFLQENSALQQRPAVTVAPVIGAVQTPLPVLMALWAGVEKWSSTPQSVGALVGGLALVAAGAAVLGRSHAVASVAVQAPVPDSELPARESAAR